MDRRKERTDDMIELGRKQELQVLREKEFGVYLGEKAHPEASVLLPKKQVPEGTKLGDSLQVFIYKDSEDRLIATTAEPKLEAGQTALLKIKEITKIGAFLDMGLEKDLLLQSPVKKSADSCYLAHLQNSSLTYCKHRFPCCGNQTVL